MPEDLVVQNDLKRFLRFYLMKRIIAERTILHDYKKDVDRVIEDYEEEAMFEFSLAGTVSDFRDNDVIQRIKTKSKEGSNEDKDYKDYMF